MFRRLEIILAAFDDRKFCEVGLALRLREYVDRSAAVERPSRTRTTAGMPVVWCEP